MSPASSLYSDAYNKFYVLSKTISMLELAHCKVSF
jgi:hypothetical protein